VGRSETDQQIDLAVGVEAARRALTEAAKEWGADWQSDATGGDLHIPVTSGLRRGVVRGRVALNNQSADQNGLHFRVEQEGLELNAPAVGLLLVGAAGCGSVVLWPFFPRLLPLVPVGLLTAVATWLMVVSRLRNSGVEEFLTLVKSLAEEQCG
jgi:hypothetical protein